MATCISTCLVLQILDRCTCWALALLAVRLLLSAEFLCTDHLSTLVTYKYGKSSSKHSMVSREMRSYFIIVGRVRGSLWQLSNYIPRMLVEKLALFIYDAATSLTKFVTFSIISVISSYVCVCLLKVALLIRSLFT